MPWDDNNVSKLRELWDQGLPTAQIGKLLGFIAGRRSIITN